jgi:hypothetical protein
MPKPYPAEFRVRAVALVRAGRTITAAAAEFGLSQGCLHNWVKQDQVDRGERAGLATPSWRQPGAGSASSRWSWRSSGAHRCSSRWWRRTQKSPSVVARPRCGPTTPAFDIRAMSARWHSRSQVSVSATCATPDRLRQVVGQIRANKAAMTAHRPSPIGGGCSGPWPSSAATTSAERAELDLLIHDPAARRKHGRQ